MAQKRRRDLVDLQEVRAELVRYGYLTLEPREKAYAQRSAGETHGV